jgi:hypothetical protein
VQGMPWGGRRKSIAVIREHSRVNLRDRHLMLSQVGGDPPVGYPATGVWVDEDAWARVDL